MGVWAEVRMDGKAGIHPELPLCQPLTPVNKATDLKKVRSLTSQSDSNSAHYDSRGSKVCIGDYSYFTAK